MTRFVTIAVVLALTSTASGAQNATPLTPQQKQDLTGYNFKGAETALQAQSNQPAAKQQSLTPIPALKVPPIVSSISAGQASQSTASTEKGSAVPLNWKLPHADLNAVGLSAAEVSRLWETSASMPTQGENGKVVYIYGQGMPVLVARRFVFVLSNSNRVSISKVSRRLATPAAGRSPRFSPVPVSMRRPFSS